MLGERLGHYRIIEKIGAGGMGEVYRAYDELLERDVAIKILSAEVLADEEVRMRFRREALVLAKLNHPYIETIHEFGHQDDIDFLVMELIPGRPLSKLLKDGPLDDKELLRLSVQFLKGLSAAHEQGVIHRDLKPANLFVTPDGRVKILDFGLAKVVLANNPADLTRSITTNSGVISGTVPYMAPEQLRGEPSDARSDIYSAGAVLYEMATGRRPFPQTQGAELIGAILHATAASPRSLNPRIAPGLESGIMKALEKAPSQRYQSAREFEAVLESLMAGSGGPFLHSIRAQEVVVPRSTSDAATKGTPRLGPTILGSAAIVAILTAGLLIGLNVKNLRDRLFHHEAPGNGPSTAVTSPIKARRSVAVLGFKNVSGRPEEAWLSTALSEMLTTELAAGEQLRTVPGENVARMKVDLSLPDADTYGKETLGKIRQNLGTDDVVLGAYVPLEKGQIRLDLRLQNTAEGETLAVVSEKGTEAQLDDLVQRAGLAVREKLGAGAVSDAEAAAVKASLPSNPAAARLYAEGIAKLRVFDNLAARDLLQKAVQADPQHALAHAYLSAAWSGLGYDEKAAAEAKRAFDLSGNLSRQDHLSVEGLYRDSTREWDKAIEIYKTLYEFFPDNLDYGLLLARAQVRGGNGKGALDTVEGLRKMPAPQTDDPRIDLAEAGAAQSISDFAHELKAATQAADKGKASGARLLVARALLFEGVALRKTGKQKEAMAAVEDARKIYEAAGDRNGVAAALNSAANALANQGDVAGSKKMYENAYSIYHEIGNTVGAAKALDNIGTVISDAGDVEGGKKLSAQALALLREAGDKTDIANTANNLATYLTLEGDLAAATKLFRESIEVSREVGDKGGQANALSNIGELLAQQGDVAGSKTAFNESLRLHLETGLKDATAYQHDGLGKLLMDSGDLAGALQHFQQTQAVAKETDEKPLLPAALGGMGLVLMQQGNPGEARKALEQALAIDKEISYQQEYSEVSIALAELDFEEGRLAEAQAAIPAAIKVFHAAKLSDDEIAAHALLARVLLNAGKTAEARKELDAGRALATKTQNKLVGMDFAIADARVLAASGKAGEENRILLGVIAGAKKMGLVRYELEARLASGEIVLKSGAAAEARKNLDALAKDASAKGYVQIARKAAEAAAANGKMPG
jgi:serine/threonine protein kinase/tetratricopeptide (TPR) repeat protein